MDDVQETLHGIVSIRDYEVEQDYTSQLAAALDRNIRAKYLSDSVARWLSVYSTALASLLVLGVGLTAVFTRGSALAASIGLGITQANMLIFMFRHLIDQACQMETTMVSVERVQQYSQVDQEAPEHNDSFQPPKDWPQAGVIEFDNYSTTYRPELDPVLKNLSITIAQGQKVGIVGRTGSGKSTMTLALFRIMEALEGRIKIDGVDVSQLGLKDLRSQLCIIPQDPMLFAGSLQDNLDPLREYDDAAIWRALELANMSEFVSSLEGKLEAPVDHGGSNFSSGQKQLLTLAAAILRKRKIVIFDEATSATDAETDAIVQRTIRQEFKECSVLTIAHRINTIYDSDMILVLDQGKVAEFAPPQELLKNEESLFTKLKPKVPHHPVILGTHRFSTDLESLDPFTWSNPPAALTLALALSVRQFITLATRRSVARVKGPPLLLLPARRIYPLQRSNVPSIPVLLGPNTLSSCLKLLSCLLDPQTPPESASYTHTGQLLIYLRTSAGAVAPRLAKLPVLNLPNPVAQSSDFSTRATTQYKIALDLEPVPHPS
ncbi:P-loop containing nucleoside triphosphate hydrolase protein [Catenaria anguillulae PL171]|uniref:p-loop containing nucleoside triphosphate hydrolase protein n=1 Tax=Catenaria anguillulae PL171 TaxID=765915 RepID=A0A1Y2HSS6_9FUNG|nr:P-loop containing nucleoside triphosphate hydrolase protein [Catenaria anguillulae PL171]